MSNKFFTNQENIDDKLFQNLINKEIAFLLFSRPEKLSFYINIKLVIFINMCVFSYQYKLITVNK